MTSTAETPAGTDERLEVGFTRQQYLDPDWFTRELDTLFRSTWQYAAHESQLPEPHSWVTVEVLGESVVITRDGAGELHALFNTCRHRGATVCDPGPGTGRRLVCPYHQWSYDMDGSLKGAPAMPDSLDTGTLGLRTAGVTSWNGFVFVNLVAGPEGPGELVAADDAAMDASDLRRTKIAAEITYDVGANWKAVYENYLECYHCAANHPELAEVFDLSSFFTATETEESRAQLTADPFPLRAGARSFTTDGDYVCRPLLGGQDEPAGGWSTESAMHAFEPDLGTSLLVFPDYAILFTFSPRTPEQTIVRCQWFVHESAQEGTDYQVDKLVHLWDVTNRQDWPLCERTQQGIHSLGYVPGPRHPGREPYIASFTRRYWESMEGGAPT